MTGPVLHLQPHRARSSPARPARPAARRSPGSPSTTAAATRAAYDGALFFADYSRNCIWVMSAGANGLPDPAHAADLRRAGAPSPVDLQVGPERRPVLRRLQRRHDPPHHATSPRTSRRTPWPRRRPTTGPPPLTVQFDGARLERPGSGRHAGITPGTSTATAPSTTPPRRHRRHIYTTTGSYTARLRVTDGRGGVGRERPDRHHGPTRTRRPRPRSGRPRAAPPGRSATPSTFSGSATDAQEGPLGPAALSWTLSLVHCSVTDPTSCHTHHIQDFHGSGERLLHGTGPRVSVIPRAEARWPRTPAGSRPCAPCASTLRRCH